MIRDDISRLRENYDKATLEEKNALDNPISQFEQWFHQATEAGIYEPNAMTLATSNDNLPDARIVLLKSFDNKGFVFFTNYYSAKGLDIEKNPNAALVFLWKELERQVRIRGRITKVDQQVSETYFKSRPIESQCGAIASNQSKPIESREALNKQFEEVKERYQSDEPSMPDYWGGYVVTPSEIEFWQGREGRMHDRLLYTKKNLGWEIVRLQP